MINGSPDRPQRGAVQEGRPQRARRPGHDRLASSTRPTGARTRPRPRWSRRSPTLGEDKIVGVYAANDGMATGDLAAMKGGRHDPLPPVTGQDAELAAIQRILTGDQYMTVYKADQARGRSRRRNARSPWSRARTTRDASATRSTTARRTSRRSSWPVVVTSDNVKDTVVKRRLLHAEEICTAAVRRGLQEGRPQ